MSKCQFQFSNNCSFSKKIKKIQKNSKKIQKNSKKIQKNSKNSKKFKKIQKGNLPLSAFRFLALAGGHGLGRSATMGRPLLADDLEFKRLLRRGSLPRRVEGYVGGVRYTQTFTTYGLKLP
jgi:hypothetical protein